MVEDDKVFNVGIQMIDTKALSEVQVLLGHILEANKGMAFKSLDEIIEIIKIRDTLIREAKAIVDSIVISIIQKVENMPDGVSDVGLSDEEKDLQLFAKADAETW